MLLTKSNVSHLTCNSCLLLNLHRTGLHIWRWSRCNHYGGEAVLKQEKFPIDKIYVPVKRRSEVVQEIAESILEIGQQAPILVRPDQDRFVLVEGLHRLDACKALGGKTIIGLLVSAQVARQDALLPHNAQAEVERQKMARLRKLRLEKAAAEKLAVASTAAKATPSRRRTSESPPRTLSEWLTKQERDGGRY
jgi:ParB-like nuclease family protein